MIRSADLVRWQDASVTLWHQHPVVLASLQRLGWGDPEPLLHRVLVNHELNFRLWHEEDLARDPQADDTAIAAVKRRIDALNQARNDAIEQIDQTLAAELAARHITAAADARLSTETPGMAIDRLSILALRQYHYAEQQARQDLDAESLRKRTAALQLCRAQRDRLAAALDQLLRDIVAGRCQHGVFHQLKMYNDPALNPVLYRSGSRPDSKN